MPRPVIFLLVLVFSLVIPQGALAKPVIEFDKEEHDYGKVQYGDTVNSSFKVINSGDETLVLKKITTSCGCTKVLKGLSKISPGESSVIEVSFNTVDLRQGRKKKKVIVYSNDPDRAVVTLHIYADIKKDISIEPYSLAKKLDGDESELIFPLTLKNDSQQKISFRLKEVQGQKATAKMSPETIQAPAKSNTDFKLTLRLKRAEAKYFYLGRVVFGTDHPVEKEVKVKYLVEID